jgi:hypothetical protein
MVASVHFQHTVGTTIATPEIFLSTRYFLSPVTIAERSEACTVFARSVAEIVGSNPTQGMDFWYVYVFILCLCSPVFRYRPCDELITRQRSPTVCKYEQNEKKKTSTP